MSAHSALIHLAVALDGAGWHPGAWRDPDTRPADLFTAGYWADLVAEAQRGLLDFVTIEDGFTLQSDDRFAPDRRVDRVRGRLDAVLIAARVAPRTAGLGLMPTITTTHSEPFHLSKAIATLDYVSGGRAGAGADRGPSRCGRALRPARNHLVGTRIAAGPAIAVRDTRALR